MARTLQTLVSGLSFAEAPRWHAGALWLSDMHADRVVRVSMSGALEVVAQFDGPVSGLGWLPDGRLLVVSMHDRRVLRLEHDGRVVEHASIAGVAPYHANDMIVAADGTAYAGNFGYSIFPREEPRATVLARIAPDGSVTAEGRDLWFPNGMVITPDATTLIVAESGAARLTAFDVATDGKLGSRRVWAEFGTGQAPDGICLDAEGLMWVAMPRQNKFVRVREGGDVVETIEVDDYALACVLGGADRRVLFLLTSGETHPDRCAAALSARVRTTRVEIAGAGRP